MTYRICCFRRLRKSSQILSICERLSLMFARKATMAPDKDAAGSTGYSQTTLEAVMPPIEPTFQGSVKLLNCLAYTFCNICSKLITVVVVDLVEYRAQVFINPLQQIFIPILLIYGLRTPIPCIWSVWRVNASIKKTHHGGEELHHIRPA